VETVQTVCAFGKPFPFTERSAVLMTLSLVNISHISTASTKLCFALDIHWPHYSTFTTPVPAQ
jgi:hypothetical protein